jgi:hypothetical protein
MQRICFLILLMSLVLPLTVQQQILAQCNSGSFTVTRNSVISGNCIITGDLIIQNGATLNVDLTSAVADTFVVRGNIVLLGNAVLWIHAAPGASGEQFIVSNTYSNQRTITTRDSSRLQLEHIEFRTQEGALSRAASIYMNYNAENNSTFFCNKSKLNRQTAWLLCNMKNTSTLIANEPDGVPTEAYLQDSARGIVNGPNTDMGLWVPLESITGTLHLPANQTQAFTWKVGRGAGGLATPWYLEINNAKPGLGVQIFPSANITINGAGMPATGELKVALMFANGTDTITNLKVGLQNTTVTNGRNGRVTLNNVQLGPIAWQLYALMRENLLVRNSIINEIGIAGPSQITVENSLLQLAVLAAVGVGGSTLTINNSELWNQSITAAQNSRIFLNNCKVYGSAFSTADADSRITVNGGCFFSNPSPCSEATMVNIATGQPLCNPFIPPGLPQNITPATVTFTRVNSNCTTGMHKQSKSDEVIIFPNPSNTFIQIHLPTTTQHFSLEVYSLLGQRRISISDQTYVDISLLPQGMYIVNVKQESSTWTKIITKN